MSTSDRTNDDPVWNEASAFELDAIPEESKNQIFLQHSDPVAMPTMEIEKAFVPTIEKIRACGVSYWFESDSQVLLRFEFANEDQGLISVTKRPKNGPIVKGKYNGTSNEIVFEDNSENLTLDWSEKKQTFSIYADRSYTFESIPHDLSPIRTYYQSCPLKWLPMFQIDAKWLSYQFPKGKLGQVHTCRLYIIDDVNLKAQGVPVCGDGLDENGPYSLEGFVDFNSIVVVITIQKTWTGSGKTANIKCKEIRNNYPEDGFMGSVKAQNDQYFIRPILPHERTGDGLPLAVETAFAMDNMLEEAKELFSTQPQNDFSAQHPFLNHNLWNFTFRGEPCPMHLYFYGTMDTNCIGVIGFSELLLRKEMIYGQIALSTQKMILNRFGIDGATWLAAEQKFQGQDMFVVQNCVIEPVINKYENSKLYDILQNPQVQVDKPNMMILKAVFEGKIKGAKVYSVPNRERGQSILEQEAKFQRLLGNEIPGVVKIHEAFSLSSPSGEKIVLIMDWYKNGSMSHQIKLRAHLDMKFTEEEILTILCRLLLILLECSLCNIWHRDLKPDNILANYDGLPHLMDYGEAIRAEKGLPSKLAGTGKYMSYKMKTALKAWNGRSPFPTVDHDLEASDVMSLALTVIAMCRLREDAILNELDTCDERQKIVWEELRQSYSEDLVVLLQSMMRQDEKQRPEFWRATYQVENLFKRFKCPWSGLSQIWLAPEVDQTSDQEYEDRDSETVSNQTWTTEGQGTVHIYADRNIVDQNSLIEALKNCRVNGSMSQFEGSDIDEDLLEEEKLDY